jgi:ABC-type uncharacterized transport system permease subunit
VNTFVATRDRLAVGPAHVARFGIVLAALAFFLTLPPVETGYRWVPALVGIVAAACGVWAVSRGVRRLGWGAVAAGLIGIGLGNLAVQSSSDHLTTVVSWGALVSSTLIWATPLCYAAVGGMFSERSGVVNIGLEGMMLSGAFFACLGADKFNSWGMGILTAMVAGAGFALVHAFFAIHLRADQIVGGTAINFLALGVTGYFFIQVYGENGTPGDLPAIPQVHLGKWLGFDKTTFLGDAFGDLNLMIWLSFVLLVVAWLVLFRTPIGLRLRAVGEHPRAADTVGIPVYLTRYLAVVTSAVIFGNWRPFGAYAAAILFGASTALSFRLATYSDAGAVLFQSLPYVLTLIAVAGVIGRSIPPAAVGRPYTKQ